MTNRFRTLNDSPEEIDAELDLLPASRPYGYMAQTRTQTIHHFYLSESIQEVKKYSEMIHIIAAATEIDVIHIHINTPGGCLSTTVQLVNAMDASAAHIICSLESEAYSAGTIIFLHADEFIVHDNCIMMFHNYSGGVVGKGHEQHAELLATIAWFTELARATYIPFLTEDEVDRIIDGGDLWMLSSEIRTRLELLIEFKTNEMEAAARELEEITNPPAKKTRKKRTPSK